jgi:hypothetical protein
MSGSPTTHPSDMEGASSTSPSRISMTVYPATPATPMNSHLPSPSSSLSSFSPPRLSPVAAIVLASAPSSEWPVSPSASLPRTRARSSSSGATPTSSSSMRSGSSGVPVRPTHLSTSSRDMQLSLPLSASATPTGSNTTGSSPTIAMSPASRFIGDYGLYNYGDYQMDMDGLSPHHDDSSSSSSSSSLGSPGGYGMYHKRERWIAERNALHAHTTTMADQRFDLTEWLAEDRKASQVDIPMDRREYAWNERFQVILDLPESLEKYTQLAELATDFLDTVKQYGETILTEYFLPDDKKTIRTAHNLGGMYASIFILVSVMSRTTFHSSFVL